MFSLFFILQIILLRNIRFSGKDVIYQVKEQLGILQLGISIFSTSSNIILLKYGSKGYFKVIKSKNDL